MNDVIRAFRFKPLDIVKTPSGQLAVITTVSNGQYSINMIGPRVGDDRSAWWTGNELEYIDNIPNILACAAHYSACGGDPSVFYGVKTRLVQIPEVL